MKTYVANDTVTVHEGKVTLSPAQYKRRASLVDKVGGDVYLVVSPVQFKAGEIFGYDGEIPKHYYSSAVEVKGKTQSRRKASKTSDLEELEI